jgi:tryptophanyl-tRNA synthetase
VLSGIQPTSDSMHLGNYLGATRQWAALQDDFESFFFIADLHALTVAHDPKVLGERCRRSAAQLIAAGVDPARSTVFLQSHVPAHAQAGWVFQCLTRFGEARRMTQFKDKTSREGEGAASVGLLTYPILQAADILLYRPQYVPVGEDQRQHLELTRDLAQRFNSRFGETFRLPAPYQSKQGERIKDLQQPEKKMSKSLGGNGTIWVLDSPEVLTKKIKRAVTDTGREVVFDEAEKPGVSNLLTILSVATGKAVPELEAAYAGKGYGDFKGDVADAVVEMLAPLRARFAELMADPAQLDAVLANGAVRASEVAHATMAAVREHVGLLPAT